MEEKKKLKFEDFIQNYKKMHTEKYGKVYQGNYIKRNYCPVMIFKFSKQYAVDNYIHLTKIAHENLFRYFNILGFAKQLYIIQEYYEGMTLKQFLTTKQVKKKQIKIRQFNIIIILQSMIRALIKLENHGFNNHLFELDNICLFKNGKIKLRNYCLKNLIHANKEHILIMLIKVCLDLELTLILDQQQNYVQQICVHQIYTESQILNQILKQLGKEEIVFESLLNIINNYFKSLGQKKYELEYTNYLAQISDVADAITKSVNAFSSSK